MIETKRLKLRRFTEYDRGDVIALLKEPTFMVYSPTGAMTQSQADSRFRQLLNAFKLHGIGKFAVIEKWSGELIGYCGIESFNFKNKQVVELGYRLKASARGNGYATEASEAVLIYAKDKGFSSVMALTEQKNEPSKHILLKLGFNVHERGLYQKMKVQYFIKEL